MSWQQPSSAAVHSVPRSPLALLSRTTTWNASSGSFSTSLCTCFRSADCQLYVSEERAAKMYDATSAPDYGYHSTPQRKALIAIASGGFKSRAELGKPTLGTNCDWYGEGIYSTPDCAGSAGSGLYRGMMGSFLECRVYRGKTKMYDGAPKVCNKMRTDCAVLTVHCYRFSDCKRANFLERTPFTVL